MKVGDLVRQYDGLLKIKKNGKNVAPKMHQTIGTVIAIHEGLWPKDWDISEEQSAMAMRIGKRIDVLWSNGRLTKNFAENALKIVSSTKEGH